VRRADAGAGQHGHDHLGDHRQVDPDNVTLPDPLRLERVRQPLHVAEELGVGQLAFLALLTSPVERDPVAAPGQYVPVEAVVRHVDGPVGEPGVERRVAVIEHRGERRVPVQPLAGLRRPPGHRVGCCLLVDGGIAHLRPGGEIGRRRELLDLQQLLEAVTERGMGIWHVRSLGISLLACARATVPGTPHRSRGLLTSGQSRPSRSAGMAVPSRRFAREAIPRRGWLA